MLGRTDSRTRLLLLLAVFIVASVALMGRLAYWQVVQRDVLAEQAIRQTTVRVEEPTRRGEIYDRSGTVVLATTVERDRLVASTNKLTDDQRRQTGDELVRILGLDVEGAAALREKLASGKAYIILAREVEPTAADRIRAAGADRRLTGISLEPEPMRIYPQGGGSPDSSLAAQLLGFVNRDGKGQYGVEQAYQDSLAGSPRVVVAERDTNGRTLLDQASVVDPGVPGRDVRLTIDAGLQLAVEQELLAAWVADKAKSVSAVVMDPYTGEIYAEATVPSYDANQYRQIAGTAPERFIDPVVSNVYEPGSVFKMMTATAALENGSVSLSTRIKDVGTLRLDNGKTKVDDADRKGRGWMTFEDAVAFSRNVVAAKVALGLGKNTRQSSAVLYDWWLKLGFGAPTGIDVAGEVPGIVRDPGLKPWAEIDLANGAFGQGVAVTPIQLAAANAVLMNGGTTIHPHVVKAVGTHEVEPVPGAKVISRSRSRQLIGLMNHVVTTVPFYKSRTLVPGYDVGGKTGTAQIWDPEARGGRGGWKVNLFNYSFIGYIARERGVPDLVVAIRIEEGHPTVVRVGQLEMPVMSFELFRRIATDAITTPDLLTDRPMPPDPNADR
jgi:cell division protein FtsI/penicillin-binding protein 2